MNKKAIFTFGGVNQDISKSKHSNEYYYEGNNIRITSTDSQSTGAVTNEKGNKLVASIPAPSVDINGTRIRYGNKSISYTREGALAPGGELEATYYSNKQSGTQTIIGHIVVRESVLLFSTDNNGFDCIWEFKEDNSLSLLYMRDLGFSTEKPLQGIFNYENEKIQKAYWVDGNSQLRFINIRHSKANGDKENLIDLNSNSINLVGNFKMAQPIARVSSTGGNHTAGVIQYAYNLYRVNGTQTKPSPLSDLVSLGKTSGGGDVNEVVGASTTITITDLDPDYTNIRIYAIKYTSYNQAPTISLIEDRAYTSTPGNILTNTLTINDRGNVINELSLAEFMFLGSDPVTPKHIESKDNTLFLANVQDKNFDVELDTRAYGHNSSGVAKVRPNGTFSFTGQTVSNFNLPSTHDAINWDLNTFKYQANGYTEGGEGKYLKYEFTTSTSSSYSKSKTFKDDEVYRIGIQFYNKLGQVSFPKWIADFKAPDNNFSEFSKTGLKVTFKSEFFEWLNTSSNFATKDDKPIGFKVLRANRTINDQTIIAQGVLNGMISNIPVSNKSNDGSSERRSRYKNGAKLPSLQRPFDNTFSQLNAVNDMSRIDSNGNGKGEVFADGGEYVAAETYQCNSIIQMFSPEAMFGNVPSLEGLQLRIKGAWRNSDTRFWAQERNFTTKEVKLEAKSSNFSLTPKDGGAVNIRGTATEIGNYGIFAPHTKYEDGTGMDFYQFYRKFSDYFSHGAKKSYLVYGSPQLTEKGQGRTSYNNDATYSFYNTLEPLLTDRLPGAPSITSVNSWGAKCLTLVLGSEDVAWENRPTLDKLFRDANIPNENVALVGELVRPTSYIDSIYGGNTYEAKKRTNYLEIGNYTSLASLGGIAGNSVEIESPGDIFMDSFRFTKLCKTDTEVYSNESLQVTEIVEFPVETSIDLKNRNDESISGWDSRFQPRYDDYHKYNRVYSQQPTLFESVDVDYNFKPVRNYDTRIMASSVKIPGENIDSWTNLLVNETIDLDGKYGPINSLVSFRDNIFAIQDKGVASVAINPRVQVQGSDGIGIELGTGRVLHDYRYLSTTSGSINKWGVIPTKNAIYFLDAINKSFNRLTDRVESLSDTKGLHTWFQNNLVYEDIKLDNPLQKRGVVMGYDQINNSIMLTLLQKDKSYTRLFNEARDTFVGLMDYKPSRYITNNSGLYMLEDDTSIYQHFKGNYNEFFGKHYPSYITLLVNPATNYDNVFNNIEFNSELYLNDIDQSNKTLTHISAWNEYQDSGRVPLVLGRSSNLRRKFRTWRANIPRDGRNRMRNPWIYLKLELDNTDNYKMVLHDIIIDYIVN